MSDLQYSFRPAAPADAEIIAHHRAEMFLAMGTISQAEFAPLVQASIPWLQRLLAAQEYAGWFAISDGKIVAGGGIQVRELPPVPGCIGMGRWGYIMNIYTVSEHRGHGLARAIMKLILDWSETEKLDRVTLTAAPAARPLYESLGFTATRDMELIRTK